MKKLLALVIAFVVVGSGVAVAHQPVVLLNSDTTAAKGPLLVDGTVSFAVRAAFAKAGEKKAFRAQFKEGDALEIQYLIIDKKPENALKMTQPTTRSELGTSTALSTQHLTQSQPLQMPAQQNPHTLQTHSEPAPETPHD